MWNITRNGGWDPRPKPRHRIKGCHCSGCLSKVHSLPRPTTLPILFPYSHWSGARILSWCYMSWKLFEWMINIYGWAAGFSSFFFVFFIFIYFPEAKRNKINSLLLSFVCCRTGKRPSNWYGAYEAHTKGSPDSTSSSDSRLICPAGSAGQIDKSSNSRTREPLTHGRRPASNLSTQCECFDTPLSSHQHQHHSNSNYTRRTMHF